MYTIAEADDPPADETADTVCSVCGRADVGSVQCGGDPSHSLCSDCFDHYAVGAFQAGGAFCASVSSNGIESPRGDLPCPLFPAGECTCREMPVFAVEHLSAQTLEQKDQAFRRLAEEQQEETRQDRHDVGPTDLSGMLLNAVQEVLFFGASVACPSCGYRGEKDGACMHITCENTDAVIVGAIVAGELDTLVEVPIAVEPVIEVTLSFRTILVGATCSESRENPEDMERFTNFTVAALLPIFCVALERLYLRPRGTNFGYGIPTSFSKCLPRVRTSRKEILQRPNLLCSHQHNCLTFDGKMKSILSSTGLEQ